MIQTFYLILKNLIQPCALTSVADVEGTFNYFTTLLPQSVKKRFQRKLQRLRKYQERLEPFV